MEVVRRGGWKWCGEGWLAVWWGGVVGRGVEVCLASAQM